MQLHFDYKMLIRYTEPVTKCFFTIKGMPREDERQHVLSSKIEMDPKTSYMSGVDSFGNQKIYGRMDQVHQSFLYHIEGDVEIRPIAYEEKADQIGMYKYLHGKCIAGSTLKQYADCLEMDEKMSDYQKALFLMNKLYSVFQYCPSSTRIETNAEDAWQQGMGVCQDYAHIFITLLRLKGIPARYVCGFLIGEGASHAWVEACIDGYWIGLDPTNNCLVKNEHIKIGHGRDADDCAINRGIMYGGGQQTQEISVFVYARGRV